MPASLLGRGLDLLFPRRCVHCGRFGDVLCAECEQTMSPCSAGKRCPNCCASWDGEHNCPRCFGWDALDGASVAVDMAGAARKVVHGLKYRYIRSLAPVMARQIDRMPSGFDVAFAIPLHRSRLRQRGFNQAQVILELLAWPAGEGKLERVRKTDTQVGMDIGQRRANIAGAFAYTGPSLQGMSVALIDDVVTTGATANECARVLRDYGARAVRIYAFARTNYDPAPGLPIDEWATS